MAVVDTLITFAGSFFLQGACYNIKLLTSPVFLASTGCTVLISSSKESLLWALKLSSNWRMNKGLWGLVSVEIILNTLINVYTFPNQGVMSYFAFIDKAWSVDWINPSNFAGVMRDVLKTFLLWYSFLKMLGHEGTDHLNRSLDTKST